MNLSAVDITVIAVYILGLLGLGCWAGYRQRSKAEGSSYFLAGKSLKWPIIGLALFATNISTIHLVSLSQEGYINGLAYGNFEWLAIPVLIILAIFFAPFYIRANVSTLPDFLEKRYNRTCRDLLAFFSIISAIFVHMGFSLYTGAVVLNGVFGIDINLSIWVIALVTGFYTVVGGLLAVVLTESIQTVILLAGSICIAALGFWHVGGWSGLEASVEPVKLTMLRPAGDPSGLPWYSVFLGYPILGIWYFCADQTIVQRVLGAKDENHARMGPMFTAFLKILPVFIFVLPGLICLALVNQGKIPPVDDPRNTYAHMINNILPAGLKGIMAAALLSAIMGTVSGSLNSIATLVSYDVVKRWRPETKDRTLITVGRVATVVAMLVAILWCPLLSHYKSIFQGISIIISYISPPITAVFLLGILWRRASAAGAVVTLCAGACMGFTVFLLDWWKEVTHWPVPFMLACFLLFCLCVLIHISVSLLVPHRHTEQSLALVWKNPLQALEAKGWPGIANYKFIACVLLIITIGLYIVFR